MHPAERLAAYLADELPTDERVTLEAELARDADLRAQLERMRVADAALAELPPTALPEGAHDRLLAAVRGSLDEQLGPEDEAGAAVGDDATVADDAAVGTDAAASGPEPLDRFTARRRDADRRRLPWTAIGGVAAGLVGVVVVVTSLQGTGGDEAADTAAEAPSAESLEAPTEDAAGGADGPVLLAQDRELDADLAAELLDDPALDALAGQGLAADQAELIGRRYAAALGADAAEDPAFGTSSADRLDGEAAVPEEAPTPDAEPVEPAELTVVGDVDDADRAAVAGCLDELLADGTTAVPATAELVVFDGDPAIVYGLVSLSPEDGTATRREVWVLARDGCEVRYFGQT